MVQKGWLKSADGALFIFHYAGYFEDGTCLTAVMKTLTKHIEYDANRIHKGYKHFLFKRVKETV
jgi:hypothetical protein